MTGWLLGVGAAASLLLVGCGGDDGPAAAAKDSGSADTGSGLEAAPPDSATLDDGLVLDSSPPTDSTTDSTVLDGATDADAAETADAGPYVAPASDETLCKKDTTRLYWDGTACWDAGMPASAGGVHTPFKCTFQKHPDPKYGKPACWPVVEATVGGWDSAPCGTDKVLLRLPKVSAYTTTDAVITVVWERKAQTVILELTGPGTCPTTWRADDESCSAGVGTYPWCLSSTGKVVSARMGTDRTASLPVVTL